MKQSIKLFKALLFHHLDIEIGAPTLYNYAPFGGRQMVFLNRVAEILELPKPKSTEDIISLTQCYIQYCVDLPEIIRQANISEGSYKVPDIQSLIQSFLNQMTEDQAVKKLDAAIANNFKDDEYLESVKLTASHFKILRKLNWHVEHNYHYFSCLEACKLTPLMLREIPIIHQHSVAQENRTLRFNIPVPVVNPKYPFGDDLPEEYSPKVQKELALALQALAWFSD